MTFYEAVAILADFGADKKEKVKAMDRFPRSERFACSALLWLQKGNPEAAALSLSYRLDEIKREAEKLRAEVNTC